jgi:hypothetical protein
MESPSFLKKEEERTPLKEIIGGLKEGVKDLTSWKPTSLDTTIFQTYCRRFLIVALAAYGVSIQVLFTKQVIDRVQYEQSKKKFQEKYKDSSNESVQELYQRAVEAYGEEYIKSLPAMRFVAGEAEERVIKSAEEDKPEVFTLEGDFKLGDWDKKFTEYEKQYGKVLGEVIFNEEESSNHLIFKKDTILDVLPGETFEQWAERMDKASLDTVSAKKFLSKMETFFPKGWVQGEVGSFHYKKENPPITYAGSKGWVTLGEVGENKELSLFGVDRELSMVETFAHELGHENDWKRSTKLSPEQRLELLMKVHDRVTSESRFRSHYVESILDGSLYPEMKDTQVILQTATTEYWGEIIQEYFLNGVSNLSVDDVEVIEWMIKKVDPEFLKRHSAGGVFAGSYQEYNAQAEKLLNEGTQTSGAADLGEKEYKKVDYYRRYSIRKSVETYD